jgi:signal transduction histidine kinase
MTENHNGVPVFMRKRRWWLLPLTGWALVSAALFQARVADIHRQAIDVATEGARNIFRMVVLTRAWNAEHGGVYVPVTPTVQPNPYLDHPRRDVRTADGLALTLINPAYMTRLIAELAKADSGVEFHLTSLKPIRPQNQADAWEQAALSAFESGTREVVEVVPDQHGDALRYMAPLRVEEACLPCHRQQGYRVGDIRGGISVTQHYEPVKAASSIAIRQAAFSHAGVFVAVGLVALALLELLRRRWFELAGNVRTLEGARGELTRQLVINERLATLGRQADGFTRNVAEPLAVVMGAVSQHEGTAQRLEGLLIRDEVDEAEVRKDLAELQESDQLALSSLERALRLTQSFRRTAVDRVSEQSRIFSLRQVIEDALATSAAERARLPIEVVVDCPSDLWLQGIPALIDQILTTLTDNAVTHAFEQGRRAGRITISATRERQLLHLSFADDGVGIDAGRRARIFEPFDAAVGKPGSRGLGLFICHHIVTVRLSGSISCDSSPQAGCRFDIRFPAHFVGSGQDAPA